jgi:membrane-associated protease RseP (regulator of RpoE activity)
MSFYIYDLSFLILFSILITIFLIRNKKNVKREGILILYKTQLGIKIIKYLGEKHRKFLHYLGYFVVFVGYLLMLGGIFLIAQITYWFVRNPELFEVIKVPPITPLIPYLPEIFKIDFLPPFYFTYWIVVLAVTAVVHEFFHGIFAKANDVQIKSTGFAFLGPFAGAFVEPDEKKMKKKKISKQLAILAAGSFSNLLLSILFVFFIWGFFSAFFMPVGLEFDTYTYSAVNSSNLLSIENETLSLDFNGGLNLTKITVDIEGETKNFYVNNRDIEKIGEVDSFIAFEESPALKSGLNKVITEIDGGKIRSYEQLNETLSEKNPGDTVLVKAFSEDSAEEFEIQLASSPSNPEKAYLGIAFLDLGRGGVGGAIRERVGFFRKPHVAYQPKFSEEFVVFIYNLLWWLLFVNISVALMNMIPLGIFDGGRYFYLTVLYLTKSKKAAERAYKTSTYLFILVLVLLTFLWFIQFFT